MTARRPATVEEQVAIKALKYVSMLPGSWDKRFAQSLPPDTLTDKEAPQLWRMFIRYRKQIVCERKDELLGIAEQLAAPDFRKQKAMQREQERIDELKRRCKEQSA